MVLSALPDHKFPFSNNIIVNMQSTCPNNSLIFLFVLLSHINILVSFDVVAKFSSSHLNNALIPLECPER